MKIPLTSISAGGFALLTLSTFSLAQPIAPSPRATASPLRQPAVFDPQQFPAVSGELDRLTLTARGDVDGFILKDGIEVKTAPALAAQLALAVKPGDQVTIHGLKAAALPLVSAVSVTNEVTHRTITDSGASAPPPRDDAARPLGAPIESSGRVRMALHGPQAEINGILLESGTILRFPPDEEAQLMSLIQPRQTVVAEGIAVTNEAGTVIDVQQIGRSRDQLVRVGPSPRALRDRTPLGPRQDRSPMAEGVQQPPPSSPAS